MCLLRLNPDEVTSSKNKVLAVGVLVTILADLVNPLNPELNPICYLLALLGAHHFLHFSRIRVKTVRGCPQFFHGT